MPVSFFAERSENEKETGSPQTIAVAGFGQP